MGDETRRRVENFGDYMLRNCCFLSSLSTYTFFTFTRISKIKFELKSEEKFDFEVGGLGARFRPSSKNFVATLLILALRN